MTGPHTSTKNRVRRAPAIAVAAAILLIGGATRADDCQVVEDSVQRLEVRQTRQMMGLQHREAQRRMERERRAPRVVVLPPIDGPICPAEAERRAANKLHLVRGLLQSGRCAAAAGFAREILCDYPGTNAALVAEQLLAEL